MTSPLPILVPRALPSACLGLFVCGLLCALPGLLLPVWGYHLNWEFLAAARLFLAMMVGLAVAAMVQGLLQGKLRARFSASATLTSGSLLAACGLVLLALSPAVRDVWRDAGCGVLGMALVFLAQGAIGSLGPANRFNPSGVRSLAALSFGVGAIVTCLIGAATLEIGIHSDALWLLACLPLLVAARTIHAEQPFELSPYAHWRERLGSFGLLAGVLLTGFCSLHAANVGVVSAWLAMFLIYRLGLSPAKAVAMNALFIALLYTSGVLVAGWINSGQRRSAVVGGTVASFFGAAVLTNTDSLTGAVLGLSLLAGGLSVAGPLLLALLGDHLPAYDTSLYTSLLLWAVFGALFAPFLLAHLALLVGIRVLMVMPLFGNFIALLLLGLLLLESRLHRLLSGRAA